MRCRPTEESWVRSTQCCSSSSRTSLGTLSYSCGHFCNPPSALYARQKKSCKLQRSTITGNAAGSVDAGPNPSSADRDLGWLCAGRVNNQAADASICRSDGSRFFLSGPFDSPPDGHGWDESSRRQPSSSTTRWCSGPRPTRQGCTSSGARPCDGTTRRHAGGRQMCCTQTTEISTSGGSQPAPHSGPNKRTQHSWLTSNSM